MNRVAFLLLSFLTGCGLQGGDPAGPAELVISHSQGNVVVASQEATVRFGDVLVGLSASREIALKNLGQTAVDVTSIVVEGGAAANFEIGLALPVTIEPAGEVRVPITFDSNGL